MMEIDLEKGHGKVKLVVPDAKISKVLVGNDVAGIKTSEIQKIIAGGIRKLSPDSISSDKIVVIIPDDTRLWARGDLFVPTIVKTLFGLGVSRKNLKVIIALGTHTDMEQQRFSQLAGQVTTEQMEILNSANRNKKRLVCIGETSRKTSLDMTREAVEADHIIIFGGVLHHMAAGFGGGRKYIFPGVAGYDSIQQNHSLAMQADGTPHPGVRQGQLEGNPFSEDIDEAVDIFLKGKTCQYVAVAANGQGDIFHAEVGPLRETFTSSCQKLNQVCSTVVPRKEDFALISAGGHRTDGQLYQATKALFNGIEVVKEGGAILFVTACSEGVGSDAFGEALIKYRDDPQTLGRELTANFTMPLYVAFRVIGVLKRFNVTLVSDFNKTQTEGFGFNYVDDFENYVKKLEGTGYIIPFAENILPVVR